MFIPFIAFGPEQVMALLNKKKMKGWRAAALACLAR